MAFSNTALVCTSTSQDANSPRKFSYYSADALATIIADDYFLSSYSRLKAGDVIEIRSDTANDTIWSTAIVTASSSSTVTVELKEQESCWIALATATWQTAAVLGYVVAPFDGFIRKVKIVQTTAVTGADTVIGLEIGNVDVTGAQVTVALSGAAVGVVDEATATAANAVTEGTAVEINTDGAGDAGAGVVQIEFVKA